VPKGYKDFQRPISVADAMTYTTATWLLARGVMRRVEGTAVNGTFVMYTVPAGKRAILVSACLNLWHYAAGAHAGNINIYDGTNLYTIIWLGGPDAVDQMNEAIGGGIVIMEEGWQLRVYGNPNTYAYACCMVVEYAP